MKLRAAVSDDATAFSNHNDCNYGNDEVCIVTLIRDMERLAYSLVKDGHSSTANVLFMGVASLERLNQDHRLAFRDGRMLASA